VEEGSAAVGEAAQGQAWSRAGGGHEARRRMLGIRRSDGGRSSAAERSDGTKIARRGRTMESGVPLRGFLGVEIKSARAYI